MYKKAINPTNHFKASAPLNHHPAILAKHILICLFLLFLSLRSNGQSTWTGTVDTDWNNAANWTAGVPGVLDDATIPNVTNDPVIFNGTNATPLSVTVEVNALLTIENGATLTIDNSTSNGILNEGNISNDGLITLGSNAPIGGNGIDNYGVFDNLPDGEINIDDADLHGLMNTGSFNNAGKIIIGLITANSVNGIQNNGPFHNLPTGEIQVELSNDAGIFHSSDTFTNEGLLTFGANKKLSLDGLLVRSTFLNEPTGEIVLDDIGFRAILNSIGGVISNEGLIQIGLNKKIEDRGLVNNGDLVNLFGGTIQVEETVREGIVNGGNLNNAGSILIGTTKAIGFYGIYNVATFNNLIGGNIQIDDTNSAALNNSIGTFTNHSSIIIGANKAINSDGIHNISTFNNSTTGTIYIEETTSSGILNSVIFDNYGLISIGANKKTGLYGIDNDFDFNNHPGGSILIEETGDDGVRSSGPFTNEATLTIGTNKKAGGNGIRSTDRFDNNAGGLIQIDETENEGIFNSDVFSNEGTIIIGANKKTGKNGLMSDVFFSNTSGGIIQIEETTENGLVNSGTFSNLATINIGTNKIVGGIGIKNSGPLINQAGGQIQIEETVGDGILNLDEIFNESVLTIGVNKKTGGIGINNEGIILNEIGGHIQIEETGDHGVINETFKTFDNLGVLTLGLNKRVFGIGIFNSGDFTNGLGGQIHIDEAKNTGITNLSGSGAFTNMSEIIIGANKSPLSEGISNQGTFNNLTGGDIQIDGTLQEAIKNNAPSGIFFNQAKITIGANTEISKDGLENNAIFTNSPGGEIKIEEVDNHGIINLSRGTFTNAALITIGADKKVNSDGIFNENDFINEVGGDIQVDEVGSEAIKNAVGSFSNSGKITIGGQKKTGFTGLANEADFDNHFGGQIWIEETSSNGIFNSAGIMSNNGQIFVGINKTTGSSGLKNNGVFENSTTGEITIEETLIDGINNSFTGDFLNLNKITIGANKKPNGDGIDNSAPFTNAPCAEIFLFDNLVNGSSAFTNDGSLYLDSAVPHVPGNFINNGIIEDAQDNFPLGGSLVNNEIIIAPGTFATGIAYSPAFEYTNPLTFSILGIFTDAAATLSAGNFDANTNTFTPNPPLPMGLHILFVKIEDPTGGCTSIVEWHLTIIDPCDLPMAVCQDFDAVLDADGDVTISPSDVDGGSTADCGLQSMIIDQTQFDCSHLGTPQMVQLTITDVNNDSDVCTATVNVLDETPPVATCMDITITLNSNGDYLLSPSEIFLSGTDNCSNVTPLSVTPGIFTCEDDEQTQSAVLTVTDDNNNTATCQANVSVLPFLELIDCITMDESCIGAGDGSLTIVATAPSGQIGYSVDGGVNFQFGNVFTDLTPGEYEIVVKVFGIPEVCEKTDSKLINEGNSPSQWYKDLDGDGYTDGNTLTSCDQPAGYIAAPHTGIDCNDNLATCFPGAPEICDGLDNDCDGNIPADELDADGDGFRICEGDCDDNNASVHPQAVEICDGLDNDCNGQVDENLAGETFVGNVFFATQSQVDAWPACYSTVQGNITIMGTDIDDLTPLHQLEVVTGNLTIISNAILSSLDGLNSLTDVNGHFYLYYNFLLADCCAIDDLLESGGIGGITMIFFNAVGSHCNSVAAITAACPLAGQNRMATPSASASPGSWQSTTKMNLFPNPAATLVNVTFDYRESQEADLYIKDLLGRTVYQQHLTKDQHRMEIDLGNGQIKSGIYQVVMVQQDEILTQQLIIQK
ncbi:MAG: MopE-related protein [Bacteroidota bacterium]